jgi:hypothetical protein
MKGAAAPFHFSTGGEGVLRRGRWAGGDGGLSFCQKKEKSNWASVGPKGGSGPARPRGLEGEVGQTGPRIGRDSQVGRARWKMNWAKK